MPLPEAEKARRLEFVDRLEALCREFGLLVWSCGCCPPQVTSPNEKEYGIDTIAGSINGLRGR